jgi:hypothetical protein
VAGVTVRKALIGPNSYNNKSNSIGSKQQVRSIRTLKESGKKTNKSAKMLTFEML